MLLALAVGAACAGVALAQNAFPTVDIYVAKLTGPGCPCAPENVTHRAGYDNQPRFLPDGKSLIYTADDESGGTNIYRLNLATGQRERIASTPESEFSPTLMPDGRNISVVRIEPDLRQHLWRFALPVRKRDVPALNYAFQRVLEAPEPVGYHVWIDARTLVLFVLGEPNSLYVADVPTGKSEKIVGPIGRSLHPIPNTKLASFVDLADEKNTRIRSLDPATHEMKEIVRPLRPGDVDYAWTPDGRIVMAQEAVLLAWDPKTSGPWLTLADFSGAGLKNITRIAFSPDGKRVALVAADRE
jgi:dipeptidyl aminopeptidase/acylaminoacyl peptidase